MELIDGAPNLWVHFKDGALKTCDVVCGKKRGEANEIHSGGMRRCRTQFQVSRQFQRKKH